MKKILQIIAMGMIGSGSIAAADCAANCDVEQTLQEPVPVSLVATVSPKECMERISELYDSFKVQCLSLADFLDSKENYPTIKQHFPNKPDRHMQAWLAMNVAGIKKAIRDLELQCSQYMVPDQTPESLREFFDYLLQDRMKVLYKRAECIAETEESRTRGNEVYYFLATPERIGSCDPITRVMLQLRIDQFAIKNLSLKCLYDCLAQLNALEFSEKTQRLMGCAPILMDFLLGVRPHHPVIDECFDEAIRYEREYYKNVGILDVRTGKQVVRSVYEGGSYLVEGEIEIAAVVKPDGVRLSNRDVKKVGMVSKRKQKQLRSQEREEQRNQEDAQRAREDEQGRVAALLAQQRASAEKQPSGRGRAHTPFLNQAPPSFVMPEPYVLPDAPDKEKTRGVADEERANEERASNSTSSAVEHTLAATEEFRLLTDEDSRFFRQDEKTKSFKTYDYFVSMFRRMGGTVLEDTGSSHMDLSYTAPQGRQHKGGVWKYHGIMDRFDPESIKILLSYVTKCHFIPWEICSQRKGELTRLQLKQAIEQSTPLGNPDVLPEGQNVLHVIDIVLSYQTFHARTLGEKTILLGEEELPL